MLVRDVIRPSLHHVTLKTGRLQLMVDWYVTVVGMTVTFQDQYNAWTSNDGANHRVAFVAEPGLEDDPEKTKHNGLHHCAFEYGTFDELMATYDRLKRHNILPVFALDHGMTISLYYQDPEGNFVELQSDNFANWALSTEFMRNSADFKANPIGTFFDVEKVYQAHLSLRDFAGLQPRIRAGEYLPETVPSIGLPVPSSAAR